MMELVDIQEMCREAGINFERVKADLSMYQSHFIDKTRQLFCIYKNLPFSPYETRQVVFNKLPIGERKISTDVSFCLMYMTSLAIVAESLEVRKRVALLFQNLCTDAEEWERRMNIMSPFNKLSFIPFMFIPSQPRLFLFVKSQFHYDSLKMDFEGTEGMTFLDSTEDEMRPCINNSLLGFEIIVWHGYGVRHPKMKNCLRVVYSEEEEQMLTQCHSLTKTDIDIVISNEYLVYTLICNFLRGKKKNLKAEKFMYPHKWLCEKTINLHKVEITTLSSYHSNALYPSMQINGDSYTEGGVRLRGNLPVLAKGLVAQNPRLGNYLKSEHFPLKICFKRQFEGPKIDVTIHTPEDELYNFVKKNKFGKVLEYKDDADVDRSCVYIVGDNRFYTLDVLERMFLNAYIDPQSILVQCAEIARKSEPSFKKFGTVFSFNVPPSAKDVKILKVNHMPVLHTVTEFDQTETRVVDVDLTGPNTIQSEQIRGRPKVLQVALRELSVEREGDLRCVMRSALNELMRISHKGITCVVYDAMNNFLFQLSFQNKVYHTIRNLDKHSHMVQWLEEYKFAYLYDLENKFKVSTKELKENTTQLYEILGDLRRTAMNFDEFLVLAHGSVKLLLDSINCGHAERGRPPLSWEKILCRYMFAEEILDFDNYDM